MQNSLNLVGDDDLDVVRDIERAFGISIQNHEAESTLTVGQLHDLVETKCGTAEHTRACFSQIAFYRLRQALASTDNKAAITPDTPVSILRHLAGRSIARKWKELGRRSGLSLPQLETPFSARLPSIFSKIPLGIVAVTCLTAGVFALARYLGLGPSASFWMAALGAPLLSVAALSALHVVFRDIPRRIATVGDLAREAAGYSFVDLRQTKPAPSAADRWYALTAILRQISGHKAPISRDTTFFSR
jgi:hypothetical protein